MSTTDAPATLKPTRATAGRVRRVSLPTIGQVANRIWTAIKARCGPALVDRLPNKEVQGIFHYLFECLQELCADGAVNDAMIAGHREAHRLSNRDLVFPYDRLRRHCADGKDSALGRINDRGKLLDPKHSQIADREGCAGVLFRLQFAGAR